MHRENPSASTEMNAEVIAAEMRSYVREAAEPCQPGDSVKAQQNRASVVLRKPTGWIKRAWYGERKQYPAEEYLETRRRIEEKRRREIERLRAQLASIEAMRRDNIDALVEDARTLLGPLFDRLVAAGLVKVDGLATPKDGEER